MNLMLFIAGIYLVTFLGGGLIEKIRIPWIFSALFLGMIATFFPWVSHYTELESFSFLASLGVSFLLFIIGFELDISEIRAQGKFIISTTLGIVITESTMGTLFIHQVFGTPWATAILVGTSFATVGEGVLLPILDEFKITKTSFGQILLGIATLDDIFEVLTLIFLVFFLGFEIGHSQMAITTNIGILLLLFLGTFLFVKYSKNFHRFKYHDIASLFIFVMFLMLLFVGIGDLVESAAIGALFAGIAARQIIPSEKLVTIESEIKTMAYGFFVPLFFFQVGTQTDIRYLVSAPFLVIAILLITNVTKILTCYFLGKNRIGKNPSILLGIGLSAKFSTSIVIITFLAQKNLILNQLFSVLVGAMVVSQFIIPVLFSGFITKWKKELLKKPQKT